MCVQMLGCWLFLALSAHCDYYHTVSAMSPTTDKPTCWTLACSLPLEAPKADLSQDWLSMTSLSFFVGIRLPLPVPLASNHPSTAREWKCSSHTRGKIWAAITHCSYLEKSQKASLLLVVSFLTCCPTPPPQLHVSLLLSGAGDIYARENYYFSISRSSQNIGLPHLPVLLIHSRLCPFLPALSVCHLLPSTSAISH